MKYQEPTQVIPQDMRKDVNQKILHLIETGDMQGLTNQDVYSAYTGDGGTHGLDFKDFSNFHSYTNAKKEIENGQFFTPHNTIQKIVEILQIDNNDTVADLTCGHGVFFNFVKNEYSAYGCDIDSKAVRVSKFLYPNANIECTDIRYYKPDVKFDTVFINPPFNLDFNGVSSQHFVCKKAAELLKPLGIVAIVVPKSFMNDEMMNKKDIEMMDDNFSFLGQYELSNTEFKQMGVDNFETKVMFFQRIAENTSMIINQFENVFTDPRIIKTSISIARVIKLNNKAKTLSESKVKGDEDFQYRVKKYLYEFKVHKNLQYYLPKAKALVNKYNTQTKPEKMEWKEWEKVRLTEAKVIGTFKRVMKNAYTVDKDVIKLVKRNHAFVIKAYSPKMKHIVSKRVDTNVVDIFSLVTFTDVRNKFKTVCKSLNLDTRELDKVVGKKVRNYNIHNTPINKLPIDKKVNTWLKRFRFISKGETHKLHEIQVNDINKVIQRDTTLLAWSMGVGKSVAMLAYIKYLKKYGTQKNIFITAPAIAVDLTLKNFLRTNGVDFIDASNMNDVKSAKDGDVIIMTIGRVRNNKEGIRSFIKSRSNKVVFIFDESDEITNYNSKRTKAIRNAFRRCHKKLLMTGTTTRNNILEFYSNYEVMYNNSYNMMNLCRDTYYQDKKTKDIKSTDNKRINQPFDGYHGYADFRKCFSPSKASVFGVQKNTQDIYNSDELKHILSCTVITRTFEEVVGKKFKYHTHYVQPNFAEKTLQDDILNRFHEMCYSYFNHTGNSRKESYLRIIRMINLLIKSTAAPHLFNEWTGNGLPTKYAKIIKMISERDEKVLVGCVGVETALDYYSEVKSKFPNRKVWYIDGSVSFKKREQIIAEFEATENGIIVANQAALKSSVNIPTCNEVIIAGLPWNFSKLNQFIFRCIRFDSEQLTNVHMVVYSDSIELNVLNLLLNKERINTFMRTTDLADDESLYENYDVDSGVLGSLLQKHYDEDGGMRLSWGETEIIKS